MQKRPLVIALSIAGIIAGTHAGIAAISNENTVSAPAVAPSETQAATDAQTAIAQVPAPADAQQPADGSAQPQAGQAPAGEPLRTAASTQDDEYYLRLPFTNRQIKVTVPTFPRNSQEFADPAPSVVAYFDRRNANTQLAGAASPVFPEGSDEFAKPLPSVIAYFDQQAARQLAAAKPAAPAVTQAPTDTAAQSSVVAAVAPPGAPATGN